MFNKTPEYKRDDFYTNEKKGDSSTKSDIPDADSIDGDSVEGDDMIVKAYKTDIVGLFFGACYLLQTIGMVAYMILITYDYYQDYYFFRGDALVQSSTFMGQWYIFFIWFASLTIFRSRLSNFFRIQCTYSQAQYVQIERKEPAIIFLEDNDRIMTFVRYLEETGKRMFGLDVVVSTSYLRKTSSGTKYFIYQCTRYVYHPETQLFKPHSFHLGDTSADLAHLTEGLTTEEAHMREELIGPNFIEVYVPNVAMAVLREFATFFYIYQFTALWLFYYFAYWQVGIADTSVILVSAFVKVYVRLKSEIRIKKMAEYTDSVKIYRDGKWGEYSTADLVPGDVFEVEEGKTTPCDGVVLTGNIVADESSLTGEPLPIRKFPVRRDDTTSYDKMGAGKISSIFAGTTISQAERTEAKVPVTALVTNVGTSTDKGELVKKILFPTRVSFVFDEQIKVVILILLCCGLVCLGLAIWLYTSGTSAWFYAMFCICQLVSPLLPAALVVGQSVAAGRLRDQNIFCVDLPRILMAGKGIIRYFIFSYLFFLVTHFSFSFFNIVQIFCFDKTGTLTKEGLEFYGTQPITDIDNIVEQRENKKVPEFDQHIEDVNTTPRLMQIGLATCHAVTTLNGQFIGNPVDIEMFRSSKWKLQDKPELEEYVDTLLPPAEAPGQSTTPVHVLKRFEFVHARMSMSVAVLDSQTNKIHIFVKGAYEKIKDLSNPHSIPNDYDTVTANLARQGCYVLALSHREIDLNEIGGMEGFKNWNRDQMEENINFAGLIIFKNQLKEDTTENIAELKRGSTRTVMITGDTALTGVYIARQCGMVESGSRVLLGDIDPAGNRVVWSDVDEPETFPDVNVDQVLLNNDHTPYELAVTGKAFDWLCRNDMIRKYLLDIRVFARMTPNGKVQCIQLHMERGITAMTGDGGNDCGALRAAHVGIAMSDAEASIVSPFSTSNRSVKSCVELIRQGRGALATSITNYKYLILYGQSMMMLKIFTFYFSVTMSQNVWIAIDVFITVFLTWAVSQSKAAPRLEGQRPTARLLGPQTLASGMGLVLINWLFLISAIVMLFQQSWFRCNEFDSSAVDISKWWLLADNYEGETIAIICLFQFINNAAVFNFGYKFRQAFWKNYVLIFLWALYLAIISYCALAPPNRLGCLFRFNCGTDTVLEQLGYGTPNWYIEAYNTPLGHNIMEPSFRWKLWGLCIGNMAAALCYEKFVVLGPVHAYLAKKFPLKRLQIKK
jgi:cation-transporting ATPase 13A3/4/5